MTDTWTVQKLLQSHTLDLLMKFAVLSACGASCHLYYAPQFVEDKPLHCIRYMMQNYTNINLF